MDINIELDLPSTLKWSDTGNLSSIVPSLERKPTTSRTISRTIQPQPQQEEETDIWAWTSLVAAFFLQMTGFGYATTFGVYQDFYVREYLPDSSSSNISWIGSTQSFLMLVMGIITGPLFDKGYGYHLVLTGAIVLILSHFLLSFAQPGGYYQIFLCQGLGIGIGASLSYVPSLAVHAQHFRSTYARARAMGLAVAGVPFAGLVYPILLNSLLHRTGEDKIEAFRTATRASAALVAGLQIISLLLFRTKYDQALTRNAGAPFDLTSSRLSRFGHMLLRYTSDWPYVCIVLGLSLFEIVFFFPIFYLQLYSTQLGLNSTFSFYTLSILNGASTIGRFGSGYLTRFLGIVNMFIISTIAMTVVLFCMLAAHDVAGVATFAIFYGLCSGCYITLMAPVLSLLAEHPSEIGSRMGMCFTFTGMGSLIGTPIAGVLLTANYIWWRPIVFGGGICVTGILFFLAGFLLLRRRNRNPTLST